MLISSLWCISTLYQSFKMNKQGIDDWQITSGLILLLTATKVIFNDSMNLAILNSNILNRIISTTWISASVFMVIRFLISKQGSYFLTINLTTYLTSLFLILLNIFLMRQTTSEIKSNYDKLRKKPESIGIVLLAVIGVIDWII